MALPLPPRARIHDAPWEQFWTLVPLHALVVAFIIALLWHLPRDRRAWAPALVGFVARAGLGEHVLMGVHYPFQRYVTATGALPAQELYGGAWSAFMGLFWWTSGASGSFLFATNLLLSTLTIPLAWALGNATDRPREGQTAAWLLALAPLPVVLAGTYTMFVLATLLQAAAAIGIARRDRAADVLACASLILLCHLRPFQVLAVLLGLGLLLAQRRWLPSAAVALGIAARALAISHIDAPPGTDVVQGIAGATLIGPGASILATDPWVVPLGLTACALLGGRRAPWWSLAWLASTLPYLHFTRPTDVVRFGLPAMFWLCMLAGAGIKPERPRGFWALLALTWLPAARPLGPSTPWADEVALLLDVSTSEEILYDGSTHSPKFRGWSAMRLQGTWTAHEGPIPPGSLWWLDRHGSPGLSCAEPTAVRSVAVRSDLRTNVEPAFQGERTVGLYRCDAP